MQFSYGAPPPFPLPPAWWQPGAPGGGKGGGKGDSGSGSKGGGKGGKGGGKSGGKGGGGKGGRGHVVGAGNAQAFYSPSFVENPWCKLLPGEPSVFVFTNSGAAANLGSTAASTQLEVIGAPPPPDQLPPPSQLLSAPPAERLEKMRSAAAELDTLLCAATDPAKVELLCPIVLESLKRVRAVVTEAGDVSSPVHVPKRSRSSVGAEHEE